VNVLKPNLRISIQTLLDAGKAQREISRVLGVDRKTIRRIAREAKSPGVATGLCAEKAADLVDGEHNPPPRPPAPKPVATPSACEIHREWIESQVALGRNAMSIYQDLEEKFGFTHRYNSVKRFVAALKAREPERFDVLDALPGEEAQVDFGQGALTRLSNGKYRRPYLFVMTLKYSGKSFRKVVWKADQESWARLHEEAFRTFGGSVAYVVLDNLKQGVLEPDLYAPLYNPLYAAMLAHYGAVADAARVVDPDRKACVSYCLLFGRLNMGEHGGHLPAESAALNPDGFYRFVQVAATIAAFSAQESLLAPPMDHGGTHTEASREFGSGQ
jgi:transposase